MGKPELVISFPQQRWLEFQQRQPPTSPNIDSTNTVLDSYKTFLSNSYPGSHLPSRVKMAMMTASNSGDVLLQWASEWPPIRFTTIGDVLDRIRASRNSFLRVTDVPHSAVDQTVMYELDESCNEIGVIIYFYSPMTSSTVTITVFRNVMAIQFTTLDSLVETLRTSHHRVFTVLGVSASDVRDIEGDPHFLYNPIILFRSYTAATRTLTLIKRDRVHASLASALLTSVEYSMGHWKPREMTSHRAHLGIRLPCSFSFPSSWTTLDTNKHADSSAPKPTNSSSPERADSSTPELTGPSTPELSDSSSSELTDSSSSELSDSSSPKHIKEDVKTILTRSWVNLPPLWVNLRRVRVNLRQTTGKLRPRIQSLVRRAFLKKLNVSGLNFSERFGYPLRHAKESHPEADRGGLPDAGNADIECGKLALVAGHHEHIEMLYGAVDWCLFGSTYPVEAVLLVDFDPQARKIKISQQTYLTRRWGARKQEIVISRNLDGKSFTIENGPLVLSSKSLFGRHGKDKGDIILGTDALEVYARLVFVEVDSLVWDIDSFSPRA